MAIFGSSLEIGSLDLSFHLTYYKGNSATVAVLCACNDYLYYWLKAPDRNVMLIDAIEMSISNAYHGGQMYGLSPGLVCGLGPAQ